ncbi:MAG: LysR family transcriptional regulator [Syntrophorhabdales bacterium]|jgi:DNA-binding transcriptional LysR family regulator
MFLYSLTSLIVFSQVVKCRSFSKAADILFMTQPGVSGHIAKLEAQTGLTLIKRDRGKFDLTREGRIVYRYAERIEKIARGLEENLRAAKAETTLSLRLGTTINYARKIMPYILGGFQRRNPDIKIKLDAGSSIEMEKSLLSGQNDVVIVAYRHTSNKIQSFPFVREELVLIASKHHPLAERRAVSLSDISPYPFVIREEGSATRSVVLAAFSRMDISPSVLIEVNSTEFIKEWVAQDKGLSILIRRAVEGDEDDRSLTVVPLIEPLSLEVSVLYVKSKKHNPAIRRFIGYLDELKTSPDPRAAVMHDKGNGG